MNKAKPKAKPKPRPIKMELTSMDIAAQKRAELTALLKTRFPELVREDGVNFDQLKRTLGENVESDKERFGLQWHGKAECMKIIQQPSIATLKPARDESVNFDKSENLFIEGDNLEVLKLLQRAYFGKVKMIYIDPPYNTGKEFIYPDNYKETLDTYLKYTKQIDADGYKFSTNTDTVGRYHSNWLNMMSPRLYLARNLLRDDGVLFISIDDNEQSNLKALCDEIFGEENFISSITREAIKGGSQSKHLRVKHDYILAYAKSAQDLLFSGYEQEGIDLNLKDEKGAYAKGRELNKWGAGSRREDSPSMWFPIQGPNGEDVYPIRNDGSEGRWRLGKKRMKKLIADNNAIFEKRDNNTYIVYEKIRSGDPKTKQFTTLFKDEYINAKGTERIKNIFKIERSYFDYAKPCELIFDLMVMSDANESDIIMDFFTGSATTADAVMQLNAEDGGKRKYICVQLPEPTGKDTEAHKAGYKNIADIGKERIRRAAKQIAKEQKQLKLENNGKPDFGFKVFKLAPSNFKVWEAEINKIKNLQQQLSAHVNHVEKSATAESVLYELLLKSGYPLTTRVKKIKMAKKEVFSVDDGDLLICLDKSLNQEVMDAMADKKPSRVICLDEGFKKNDQLKTNAAHTFKVRAQQEEKEIVFMTV